MTPTWLSPYASVWKQKFPESVVPFGQLARNFKDLVKAHPAERIVAELQAYLDQTEPKFVSLARFVATFGAWSGSRPGVTVPPCRPGCTLHPERPWVASSNGKHFCRECFEESQR